MKFERIYREILYNVIEKKKHFLTQSYLQKKCKVSIGNVHYSLKPLEQMAAIEKKARGFRILDSKKILLYWASKRKLKIIYETHVDMPLIEIEKAMPQGVLFSAYSGYKLAFKAIPADYAEVFVYADEEVIDEIKKRFPKKEGKPNLILLEADEHLLSFKTVPLAQFYVDLWNIPTWYAGDFLKILEEKINKRIE